MKSLIRKLKKKLNYKLLQIAYYLIRRSKLSDIKVVVESKGKCIYLRSEYRLTSFDKECNPNAIDIAKQSNTKNLLDQASRYMVHRQCPGEDGTTRVISKLYIIEYK